MDTDILESNAETYDIFLSSLRLSEKALKSIADRFTATISREVLAAIIKEIPLEWNTNELDLNALIDYIIYRTEHINDIISVILNYDRRQSL